MKSENKRKKKSERKSKSITLAEISILILSTIAFSYIIGSSIPLVSAAGGQCVTASGSEWMINGNTLTQVGGASSSYSMSDFCYFFNVPCTQQGAIASSAIHSCPVSSSSTASSSRLCLNSKSGNGQIYVPNINTRDAATVKAWCNAGNNDYCNSGTIQQVPCTPSSQPAAASPPASPILTSTLTGVGSSFLSTKLTPWINRGLGFTSGANTEAGKVVTTTSTPTEFIPPAPAWNQLANGKLLKWETGEYIVKNAAFAAVIYIGVKFVFQNLGTYAAENANVAGQGAALGYLAVKIGIPILQRLGVLGTISGPLGWLIGAGIGIIYFGLFAKTSRYYNYQFTCSPWDAPTGGSNCQKCNQGNIPCTEYTCRSLGQGCVLANAGTGEELCVWNNSQDVNPPIIQPWTKILTSGYNYNPDNSISPPDNGVKIVPTGNGSGCIAPYTAITFGIMLNEPGKCKLDTTSQPNFDAMQYYFGGSSTSKYNHSQTLTIPDPNAVAADFASENLTIENGNSYSIYARCQDSNGNANVANYVFKFCVNPGPDTTAPEIVSTSIINGAPVLYNQSSVNLNVYVNEPANCRWSRTDQDYTTMENDMSCNTGALDINSQALYSCSTTLTGLKSAQNNTYYFRCLDQPYLAGTANESKRNANSESYKFTLAGTQPLVINQITPNSTTIKDSTDPVKVTLQATTSAGYNDGNAICYYNGTGTNDQYTEFFNTGNYSHSQDLYLSAGDYTYSIKCVDLGGNTDIKSTSFSVETDTQAPIVVRAYHDNTNLKIITDENSTCVYSNDAGNGCNYAFTDGITMQSLNGNDHTTAWDTTKTFYVKCQDEFGNQPLPDQCSMIVTPFGNIQLSGSSA